MQTKLLTGCDLIDINNYHFGMKITVIHFCTQISIKDIFGLLKRL